ncbi:hypothetical protein [Calidithermus chliarophilus]|uniref:hypothetical protein n=1 Tax=Calidithermus chliarophilus TaxID=52023 RepID=UPI000424ED66|nr:hypothetical protein [Calidithermus chliarophilus]
MNHGQAIARKRLERKLTYRKLEESSRKLAENNPLYEAVTRNWFWSMEKDPDYFLRRTISAGKLRTIIHLLWDGDAARFRRDTGLELPLLSPADGLGDPITPAAEVPLYLEGERPRATVARRATPDLPGADFMFQVRTERYAPLLWPGQNVGCRLEESPVPGELVVLLRERGLELAFYLGNGDYRQRPALEGESFRLAGGERVYGVVTWAIPRLGVGL